MTILKIGFGLLIAGSLGCIVALILSSATPAPAIPENKIPDEVWNQLIHRSGGGKWIGRMERYFCFAAFWTGNVTLVAASARMRLHI